MQHTSDTIGQIATARPGTCLLLLMVLHTLLLLVVVMQPCRQTVLHPLDI